MESPDMNIMRHAIVRSMRMLILSTGLLMSSCFPDPLEVEALKTGPPELVVSTQIIAKRELMVLLTRTFGALEGSDDSDAEELFDLIAVDDATVVLHGPARSDTLRQIRDGVYILTDVDFRPGDTYRLDVKSAGLGAVTAETQVTRKVTFSQVEADLFYNGYDDTLANITYTFEDPPEQNWYMVNVQEVEREDLVENLLNPRAFTTLFSDTGFNGNTYGERFRVYPRDYEPGDTIAVSLSNVSEEYYRFMKLRMDNRFSLLEFVSEPVNYPTNIIGGRGYFNLYMPDVEFFVFDE